MSMTEGVEFLLLPMAACALLVAVHTWFGLKVLQRGVIFVDLALAQVAALGATFAYLLGHPAQGTASTIWSLVFVIAAAALLASTRHWAERIPQEALIGVIYVVAAAGAVLMIENAPQGAEHLKQVLTGSILTVGASDLASVTPQYAAVALVLWLLRHRLRTPYTWGWDFVFYALLGVVVTSSVALAGVLLVFAFLIVPAAIGRLHADTEPRQLFVGWIAGIATSIAGLGLSFELDLPTGATLVCSFGAGFALAGLARICLYRPQHLLINATRTLRLLGAGAMLVSAAWLTAAPEADQPLLDVIESLVPSSRAGYMNTIELALHADAVAFAQRYQRESERLNALEKTSRDQGEALNDDAVRRIASFLKSYGEMRKGEEFVIREVRSRARARARSWLAPGLALLALLIVPGIFGFIRQKLNHRYKSSQQNRKS